MAEPIAKCPRCGSERGYYWQAAFVGAWGGEPRRVPVCENAVHSHTWKNARCIDCRRRVPIEEAAPRATPQPEVPEIADYIRGAWNSAHAQLEISTSPESRSTYEGRIDALEDIAERLGIDIRPAPRAEGAG